MNPRPPPSPRPPPPPPNSPPPLPPPSPSPPPSPPGYYEFGSCSCFDESTDDTDAQKSAFSTIALRSKANYIEPSAVTRSQDNVYTRKVASYRPDVWIPGGDPALNQHVQKWVGDPSTAADIAHVVSGYAHPGREDHKLQHIPLEAYRGVRPAWWPPGAESWVNLPNNSLDTAFWASVCTSACVRDHHDAVNIVLVDLLAVDASCCCYAWEDTSGVDHNVSHSAPSDTQLMEWMHDSTRVVDSLADLTTHAKLATYAVHRRVGNDYYSSALQSTVYYAQIHGSNYFFNVSAQPPFLEARALYRPNTFEECSISASKT